MVANVVCNSTIENYKYYKYPYDIEIMIHIYKCDLHMIYRASGVMPGWHSE